MSRPPTKPRSEQVTRPQTVYVSPYTWNIKYSKAEVLKHHPNGDACGSCDLESMTIAIDPGKSEDYARVTLLHEILHAAIRSSDPNIESDAEEMAVASMTGPLMACLRDNPEVVAYLIAR